MTGGRGADTFNGGSGADRATDLNPADGDINAGGVEVIDPLTAAAQAEGPKGDAQGANPLYLPFVTR